MGRALLLTLALAVAGCATPPTAGLSLPSYSPLREAFAYFPLSAPVVAVVSTDPQDPGLRRLAASGALAPLKRAAAERNLFFAQLRSLFGNPLVVGEPYRGAAPLAVLATDDAERLKLLAGARVMREQARPAGSYRGTDLFLEDGWAFGVRDRVLLASRTPRDLLRAIDTRLDDDGFEAGQLNDLQPDPAPPAVFARVYVDLATVVDRARPALQAVPLLRALGPAGVSVGASAEELRATLSTDASGAGLTAEDLPGLEPGGRRPVLPDDLAGLATTDLSGLANAAERALRAALPVSSLELDAVRTRLLDAGIVLTPQLLDGSAVITDGPAIRIDPVRPALLHAAVRRLEGRKPKDGLVRYRGVLLGFSRGVFVAGRTSAARLERLARAPSVPAGSPVVLRIPRTAPWFRRPLVLTLNGALDALTLQARSPLTANRATVPDRVHLR